LILSQAQFGLAPSRSASVVAGFVNAIAQSSGNADIRAHIQCAITAIGFDYFAFSPHLLRQSFEPAFSSLPRPIFEAIARLDPDKTIPVLDHLRQTGIGLTFHFETGATDPAVAAVNSILAQAGISGAAFVPVVSPTEDLTILAAYYRAAPPSGALASLALIGSAVALRLLALHAGPTGPELSDAQKEILKWAAAGKSNGDIATILGMSRRGCEYHLSEIYRKLGVSSRAQAVAALSRGRL